MSWVTGTQTEALSLADVNGTAFSNASTWTTGAASANVISPAQGAAWLQPNFFLPSYGASKGLHVKAHGVLSTTSNPNLTMVVVADTAPGNLTPANSSVGTAGNLGSTGTVATPTTVTNVPWEIDFIVSCVTTGSGATFLSDGFFKIYGSATNLTAARLSSSTANANTTVQIGTNGTTAGWYIELAAQWGTASASNSIQVYAYTVLGLN